MIKKKNNSRRINDCFEKIGEYLVGLEVEFEYLDKLIDLDLSQKYNLHKMVAYSRLQEKEARILSQKVSK